MLKQWNLLIFETDFSKGMALHGMVKKFKLVSLTLLLALLVFVIGGVTTSFAAGAGGFHV